MSDERLRTLERRARTGDANAAGRLAIESGCRLGEHSAPVLSRGGTGFGYSTQRVQLPSGPGDVYFWWCGTCDAHVTRESKPSWLTEEWNQARLAEAAAAEKAGEEVDWGAFV